MGPFHIGIDFGTAQTKICIKNLGTNNFTFHRFSFNQGYFLPSAMNVDNRQCCSFGGDTPRQIRFFKMLALHDEEFEQTLFRANVDGGVSYKVAGNSKETSDSESPDQYLKTHPEICSILYICYCILDVRESLVAPLRLHSERKVVASHKIRKRTSFLAKIVAIFKKRTESDIIENEPNNAEKPRVDYLLTIGIPTEYDNAYNFKRKRKMYQILFLAKQLSDEISSQKVLTQSPLNVLLPIIEKDFADLEKTASENDILEKFNEAGLFVIAETTAGIEPIRADRKKVLFEILNSQNRQNEYNGFRKNYYGNYMTMDIGAGTTDISFFKLVPNEVGEIKIEYFSSQVVEFACNQLVARYLQTDDLEKISEFKPQNIDAETWNKAQIGIRRDLYKVVTGIGTAHPEYAAFGRVVTMFKKLRRSIRDNWNYEDPPPHVLGKGCFTYGGGSRYNEFGKGELLLFNGGAKLFYNPDIQTTTRIIKLIEGKEIINNLQLTDISGMPLGREDILLLSEHLDMLNVALGLAMLSPGNRGDDWLNLDNYAPEGGGESNRPPTSPHGPPTSPHPTNEDCYIYDVFLRRW